VSGIRAESGPSAGDEQEMKTVTNSVSNAVALKNRSLVEVMIKHWFSCTRKLLPHQMACGNMALAGC
jgi:hypothetical protein